MRGVDKSGLSSDFCVKNMAESGKMRALVKETPCVGYELQEMPVPEVGSDEVLFRDLLFVIGHEYTHIEVSGIASGINANGSSLLHKYIL